MNPTQFDRSPLLSIAIALLAALLCGCEGGEEGGRSEKTAESADKKEQPETGQPEERTSTQTRHAPRPDLALGPDQEWEVSRSGAKVELKYDAGTNTFTGTLTNTTETFVEGVRIELSLSNEAKLEMKPRNLLPNEKAAVKIPAAGHEFTWWSGYLATAADEADDPDKRSK